MKLYKWKVEFRNSLTGDKVVVDIISVLELEIIQQLAWREFIKKYGEEYTKGFFIISFDALSKV